MPFNASFDDITETSARFWATFTGGDETFSRYRYVRLDFDGNVYEVRSNSVGGSSSSFSRYFYGLSPGAWYDWEAQLGYEDGAGIVWLDVYDSGSFQTDEPHVSIEKWSWSRSNGEATTAMTQRAYNVLSGAIPVLEADGGGSVTSNFSHYVWNDLVDKVSEMRDIAENGWSTANGVYPTAPECKVYTGNTLTAEKYNGVRYNIGSIRSTGILDQSPGDRITGYKILHLTDVLNDIIDNL